ncbi:uncharacterized protein L969DRAFT_97003 [Mixia osmundae IAM 14324]|uniref:Uncharacterized protein n=1 Tax=Mixia osmundae (strain CBS 9802 / IAM 14324 / JCM 22182 / KY 12970) TaxID=764103 RepID=G7E1D6_MIXOS|nr:uncharacterized protein L969DRAFT_97003 [Mixia osmundae IAM 14324]KEI36598.1 hypothetical protein L969DRAFT_97003 [Mixia osmundae IAM 14324]GAA96646.1 hypothetical protein E5Q_03317 [Mixia osmundae IAM 14324]
MHPAFLLAFLPIIHAAKDISYYSPTLFARGLCPLPFVVDSVAFQSRVLALQLGISPVKYRIGFSCSCREHGVVAGTDFECTKNAPEEHMTDGILYDLTISLPALVDETQIDPQYEFITKCCRAQVRARIFAAFKPARSFEVQSCEMIATCENKKDAPAVCALFYGGGAVRKQCDTRPAVGTCLVWFQRGTSRWPDMVAERDFHCRKNEELQSPNGLVYDLAISYPAYAVADVPEFVSKCCYAEASQRVLVSLGSYRSMEWAACGVKIVCENAAGAPAICEAFWPNKYEHDCDVTPPVNLCSFGFRRP